ncbi:hypothetical protein BU26DRAFT_151226 [Trematosphaeria pertusa]|uniref:Methyltransferase domain-containing protein n=1 Tax=Trematosphaeria pertusa TaxID=390896 RepID=A0A6A6IYL3_9PLEO|nr:uncharacterized protein BU26DRAFT_151226 [Trematosphaeria pertusa]KAF2255137.1 hypothetical protein BU26DRAFT_151226 [Trematosphaeria pertusa]
MTAEKGWGNDVPWWDERPNGTQITPAARHLLETYSGIPAEKIEDHVIRIRDEAWNIFPYPCIGQFRFLDLSLNQMKEYAEVLQRLQKGQQLLDMACCFGQEIRQLVADGAPSENIHGCDLREEYVALGYKLFGDHNTLRSKFLNADVFDENSALMELEGQFDMVYAGSFFHLWGYEDQVKASKAVARLLRPQKGSMILGRQIGSVIAAEHDHTTNPTGKMFLHNAESLKRVWEEIGDDLGVAFSVDANLQQLSENHSKFHTDDTRRIWFVIRRG